MRKIVKLSAQEKTCDKLKYLLKIRGIRTTKLSDALKKAGLTSAAYLIVNGDRDMHLEDFKFIINFLKLTECEIDFMLGRADLRVDSENLKILFNTPKLKMR